MGNVASEFHISKTRIRVKQGRKKVLDQVFGEETIRFGAYASNDVIIADEKVSGFHCVLKLQGGAYQLLDEDSTNGTYCGDIRVNDVIVSLPFEFKIGSVTVRVSQSGASAVHKLAALDHYGQLVGDSVAMRKLYGYLEKVAGSQTTVLLSGETGVGKELVAATLHDKSSRADHSFVVVDCGAIPSNLIESELFGHEKGAFTGATSTRVGAFEQASGGTIFLDEIGELPLSMQPKLLRALESRTVKRVGGTERIHCDVRVVAASNKSLSAEVNNGTFRSDLFFRLAVVELSIPPLRERLSDIPLLVSLFESQIENDLSASPFTPEVIGEMQRYRWPGNVRELRNVVERALLLGAHIPTTAVETEPSRDVDIKVPYKLAKKTLVDHFERDYAAALIAHHEGNVSAAARAAGIDRMSLHKILQRHNLK